MNQRPPHPRRRLCAVAATVCAAVLASAVLAGCGLGADPGTKEVSVRVSSDFGAKQIGTASDQTITHSETDLQLLRRHFKVTTDKADTGVKTINGNGSKGPRTRWFFYENGVLAAKHAWKTHVHAGDHIWWDLQSWLVSQPKAVVGSFPEPFTDGTGGREAPTLLNCGQQDRKACDLIGADLRHYGVKAGDQELGIGTGPSSNTVMVGTWKELHGVIAAILVNAGPTHSGIFAGFTDNDGALQIDNPIGGVAKTLHGSVGLIAATEEGNQLAPVWFVTGTDNAGVMAAAKDFKASVLDGHFAVAIKDGHVYSVPATGR